MSIPIFSSYEANKPVSLRKIDWWPWTSRKLPQHTRTLCQGSHAKDLYRFCLHRTILQSKVFLPLCEAVWFHSMSSSKAQSACFPYWSSLFFPNGFLGAVIQCYRFFLPFFFPDMLKFGIAKNYTCYIDLHIIYFLSINIGWTSLSLCKLMCCLLASASGLLM